MVGRQRERRRERERERWRERMTQSGWMFHWKRPWIKQSERTLPRLCLFLFTQSERFMCWKLLGLIFRPLKTYIFFVSCIRWDRQLAKATSVKSSSVSSRSLFIYSLSAPAEPCLFICLFLSAVPGRRPFFPLWVRFEYSVYSVCSTR